MDCFATLAKTRGTRRVFQPKFCIKSFLFRKDVGNVGSGKVVAGREDGMGAKNNQKKACQGSKHACRGNCLVCGKGLRLLVCMISERETITETVSDGCYQSSSSSLLLVAGKYFLSGECRV